jgi:hypothetical protein
MQMVPSTITVTDVVANTTIHQALDWIPNRTVAQGAPSEIDDDDVGLRTRRKTTQILTSERPSPLQG